MDDGNFRARVFYPALRRAGLRRIRVHDLRHTAASFLIATGADLAAISRQMGHVTNSAITLATYTHWFAQRTESGLGARLDALVERQGVVHPRLH
jgi:integrase